MRAARAIAALTRRQVGGGVAIVDIVMDGAPLVRHALPLALGLRRIAPLGRQLGRRGGEPEDDEAPGQQGHTPAEEAHRGSTKRGC